jgi:hypothetical protein
MSIICPTSLRRFNQLSLVTDTNEVYHASQTSVTLSVASVKQTPTVSAMSAMVSRAPCNADGGACFIRDTGLAGNLGAIGRGQSGGDEASSGLNKEDAKLHYSVVVISSERSLENVGWS